MAADPEDPVMTLHKVTKLPPSATDLPARIVQPAQLMDVKPELSRHVFTEVEDLIIHALDTISPFDAKFISDLMVKRVEV